ncbi:MAG TPA: SCO family protein [Polyangiaceae bacterium]|nr:SCO family protein [Polyangiaceae bacterium]
MRPFNTYPGATAWPEGARAPGALAGPRLSRRWLLGLGAALVGCRRDPELPALGGLPQFSLKNQESAQFGSAELRGKVWIAGFMFTRCPTICPRITRAMRGLQERAASAQRAVQLVSFSVDPENDTPDVLRQYARQYGADLSSWSFLTGELESVKRTVVDGFKLALEGKADAGAPDFGILHGSHLVLVDRDLRIRGYYASSEEARMRQLLADAAVLL